MTTIVLDREKILQKNPWLNPDTYLSQLFIVVCDAEGEITDRVQLTLGQKMVILPCHRTGAPATWKLLDRASGPCEALFTGWTNPPGVKVSPRFTIALTVFWNEVGIEGQS